MFSLGSLGSVYGIHSHFHVQVTAGHPGLGMASGITPTAYCSHQHLDRKDLGHINMSCSTDYGLM